MLLALLALLALLRRTARALVRAPRELGARGWLFVVIWSAAVAGAYVEKRPIEALTGIHEPSLATSIITALGGGAATAIYVLALLATGHLCRSERLTRAGSVLGAAGACGYLLALTGQFVLAEARPINGGALHFFALDGHGVSGHAAAVSLLAVTISSMLGRDLGKGKRRMLTVGAFAWAAVVAGSRIYLGMHFVWNVLFGIGIGVGVAAVAVKEEGKG